MLAATWSRLATLSAAAVLVTALAGCSLFSTADGDPAPAPNGLGQSLPGGATTIGGGQVTLVQKLGVDGPLRTLRVELDGRWECVDCAGDGVTSTGLLDPEEVTLLQALLADPALATETDEARQYRASCIDALTSSLFTSMGLITSQDCPGEKRPRVANEILLLLTQSTPAELTG